MPQRTSMRRSTRRLDALAVVILLATAQAASAQTSKWPAPRKAAPLTLRSLWTVETDELLYPADLHFTKTGLLVFDHGSHAIKRVDTGAGRIVQSMGRQGSGPGEFRNPGQFLGTSDLAFVVEFSFGHVSRIDRDSLVRVRVASGGRWSSGCTWGGATLLLQTSGRDTHDYFVSTSGDSARILDSLAMPWPAIVRRPFMERQAALRQLDDSTCISLPLYQREFALVRPSGAWTTGASVEQLPVPKLVSGSGPGGRALSLQGAKPGALDARAWRDLVLVLFAGTTSNKFRILDAYERTSLRYVGSLKLPIEAMRIAVRGDTIAVLGDVDGTPVISGFLLGRAK